MELKLPFSTREKLMKAAFLLLILAVFDTIFTDYGLRNKYIEEANPLMDFIYEKSISFFYTLKISLPLLLLFCITKIKPRPYLGLLIGATLLLYLIIISQHLYWITFVTSSY